jgi:probable DNA metabolism protein
MNPRAVMLPQDCDEEAFRRIARSCLSHGIAPDELMFTTEGSGSLFDEAKPAGSPTILMPRRFVTLLEEVICHSAEDRFALLYRLMWRIHLGERHLLENAADAEVRQAMRYAKSVERDVYRMHAFVRFSERIIEGKMVYVAWYEPQHRVLRRAAPFFVDRFSNMDWLIATPIGTAAWHDKLLNFGPPTTCPAKGTDAVLDEIWTTFYRMTFNPARLRVKAMMAQMPKRHWRTMPEAAHIPSLVQASGGQVQQMEARAPDSPPRYAEAACEHLPTGPAVPSHPWEALRHAAQTCILCPLYATATQTVFGEGPLDASVVFVGEQPGDQEDFQGRPFVGPAGQVFDRALAEAGIDREKTYVTNAVKHFKFVPRGKRRIHQKPGNIEVISCRTWLRQELDVIKPKLVVALGATAALSLAGGAVAVTKIRGAIQNWNGRQVLVTVHPSYLLRLPDAAATEVETERFVEDLRQIKPWYTAS